MVEIYQGLPSQPDKVMDNVYDLFKDDLVLCDAEMNRFSLRPDLQRTELNQSPFELCSDRMVRLYPTYSLSDEGVF